ncbi:MAG: BMC domain-containing protein [Anaerobacillus sp.]|uniref:BMC domain-containing protein n=1 Tax=Anaerobacillus sp. TaxID=1872506 RepID=UPI00391A9085
MKQALGLIEVIGLSAAINIADTMAKVADIQVINLEKTDGFGWITIKIEGDVAAVQAAVQTGEQVAHQEKSYVSSKVIPRPVDDVVKVLIEQQLPQTNSVRVVEQEQQPNDLKLQNGVQEAKQEVQLQNEVEEVKQEVKQEKEAEKVSATVKDKIERKTTSTKVPKKPATVSQSTPDVRKENEQTLN